MMNRKYIKQVKCVKCDSEKMTLYSIVSHQDEITEGLILCSQCNTTYPVIAGLPCFLLPELRNKEIKTIEKCYLDKFWSAKK